MKTVRSPLSDQTSQSSFRITVGRVDQYAQPVVFDIDPFSQRTGCISALETQLLDQKVSKTVNCDEPGRDCWEKSQTLAFNPLLKRLKSLKFVRGKVGLPGDDFVEPEFDEDSLTEYFAGR
jgi:hypothetical protein